MRTSSTIPASRSDVLRFIRHPHYTEAHPGEQGDGPCRRCAIAADDDGNEFLLWRSNDAMWALSRSDPRYGTDQYVEVGDFDLPES